MQRVIHAQIYKEAIAAIVGGLQGGFHIYGEYALALFARALGNELFDPGAYWGERGRKKQGQFVASRLAPAPMKDPSSTAGLMD